METRETRMRPFVSPLLSDQKGLASSPDRLISRDEVDETFGIPKRFLEIKACTGGGPAFIKVGRLTKYRVKDVLDWIENHRFENTTQVQQAANAKAPRVGRGVGREARNE